MAVKAVVFDLDGTIVTFNIDYMAVRAEVKSLLMKEGFPASILTTKESIFEMLKKAEIFLKNQKKPRRKFEEIRSQALAIAEKFEFEAAKTTSLLSGTVEALKEVRKMRLKIGLCTVNGDRATEYLLKKFKIAKYFDAMTTRDEVRNVKPSSEHLETVLAALEVNAEEAIVVGDGIGDMKCATELQAVAVGLPTGVSTAAELMNAGADYIITSITDLPGLIESVNQTSELST